MPLAASTNYPVLDAFWTLFEIFAFVVWFWLLFVVLTDVFRSRDLSGWGKAAWTVFVIFLPLIGILAYLIVRGRSMHERAAQRASEQEQAFRSYVQEAAGPPSSADQLAKLADLRQRGAISPDEFEQEKRKVLASH
ncbi:MAG: SHOCT domain-containing protein [Actinobacteria bacterium]|nr:SHOCT domain-containing protein [Actinomycetota bacterium]MBO0810077.1 SHOCT domain-containing protein [Actinomycetota bacterium]